MKHVMKYIYPCIVFVLGLLAFSVNPSAASDQLMTLGNSGGVPRFELTDRKWGGNVGDGHVSLWKGDRLAATSITIDDNIAQDHDYWIDRGNQYGFKFTWFVITAAVDVGSPSGGTWEDFRRLSDLGHDIQSHTVSHNGDSSLTVEQEYSESIAAIEENVPNRQVSTLAYPNGLASNESTDKDSTVVAGNNFIAARGVIGTVNVANRIDYLNVRSASTVGVDTNDFSDVKNIINPLRSEYRAWYVTHYHALTSDENINDLEKTFEFLSDNDDDIWVDTFANIAKYAQQRDSAELTIVADGDSYVVTLTDQLNDESFDVPLTVKVRVPDGWTRVDLAQGDTVLALETFQHEGATYVLAPVVPDAGNAILNAQAIPEPGSLSALVMLAFLVRTRFRNR